LDSLPSIAPRPEDRKNTGVSAMDSGVAPHLRGAGPIFSVQSPGTPSMWCVGVFGLRSKPLRPGVLCPAPNWPWHAFYFISGDESKVGDGEDEDEARARAALAEVASAERGAKRMQRRQCKGTSRIHGTEFRRRRQRLWHHRAKHSRVTGSHRKAKPRMKSKRWINWIQRRVASLSLS
jgi:hypothetical protein